MDKSFSEILSNAPGFTEEEYHQLRQWAEQYPYAQALRVAVACATWHLNHPHKQEYLQMAAVYAANRTVLKDWIEKTQLKKPTEEPPAPPAQPVEASIAETLMADIALLRQSMKKFEEAASQIPQHSGPVTAKATKTKKQRLLEAVQQLKNEQQTTQQARSDEPKKKIGRRKRKSEPDILLEEISSRQAIEPENNKTREQIEIIDRFIEKSPSIAPPVSPHQLSGQDLTPTIHQDQDFSEHIVSETLVEILLQQGKKDRAIEVLKKLIWKFPQKKTYFAARIDELKK